MEYKIISQSPSRRATLWFLGWGFCSSIEPYIPSEDNDIILLWDYTNLSLNIDLGRWDGFDVRAWSMGVWAAEVFMASHPELNILSTTAYCGTPRPADPANGIGADGIRLTIDNWSEVNRRKFARKIAIDATLAQTIEPLMTLRSPDSQAAELQSILDAQSLPQPEPRVWDVAIVSQRDRIFPPANQANWWQGHAKSVDLRDVPHWPF